MEIIKYRVFKRHSNVVAILSDALKLGVLVLDVFAVVVMILMLQFNKVVKDSSSDTINTFKLLNQGSFILIPSLKASFKLIVE